MTQVPTLSVSLWTRWGVDPRTVAVLMRKEIRESLRNRWFLLYTLIFAALSLGLSYVSLIGTGTTGFAGFGRTAAGLVNLVLLIVPLMGLTIGAASLSGEQENGTLAYLIAQPVGRLEVVVGKYLGLTTAMIASLMLGFGISAAVIALRSGGGDAMSFLRIIVFAAALAAAMLSVGMLVSVLARRSTVATGTALFVWLILVFLSDLGLMHGTIAFKLGAGELFHLALVNPLQVFKIAAINSFDSSLDLLGPAGLYAVRTYGDGLIVLLGGVLAAWCILPLVLTTLVLWRKTIT